MNITNQQDKKLKSGIVAWFVNNPIAANLLMVFILVAGAASSWTIQKKMFPDFDINTIRIEMSYPGADPSDVENGILIKVEEAIKNVTGIKKIVSKAKEGRAIISVEIVNGLNIDDIYEDIKLEVESLSSLPTEVEDILIKKGERDRTVFYLSLYGDTDRASLQREMRTIYEEIMKLPEVNKAKILGELDHEIAISITENKLIEHGLTFSEVAEKIRNSSIDISGGFIKTDKGRISLKTRGQACCGEDFGEVTIKTYPDGARLLLGDIGTIYEGFVEDEDMVRFNGKPAIAVRVYSSGKQSDIETSRVVREYLESRKPMLPASMQISLWGDASFYLQERLYMMLNNMAQGAIFVFLILGLFLRFRVAFWVIFGIPVCFLGALWLMPITPIPVSINMISLFAFILVLGVVVDDAIIVGESIDTNITTHGNTIDSILEGVANVAKPATFGVLTTMSAFFTLLFIDGQGAPFFESIGMVVILCLFFSLIESKLILPAHLSNFKNKQEVRVRYISYLKDRFNSFFNEVIVNKYRFYLKLSLNNRYITLSFFFGALILTIGLFASPFLRFVFFPKLPSDVIDIYVQMNSGVSIESRNEILKKIENAVLHVEKEYQRKYKDKLVNFLFVRSTGDNNGSVIVELNKSESRKQNAYSVIQELRKNLGDQLFGIHTLNFSASAHVGGSKPIYYRLTGSNYKELAQAAAELEDYLHTFEGVYDVENTTDTSGRELVIGILPEAEARSLSLENVGTQIRQGVFGQEVQRIQRGHDEVKVMLRYPRSERNELLDLEKVYIRTTEGSDIPLSEVIHMREGNTASDIRRVDGKRSIAIMAEVDTGSVEPDMVMKAVEKQILSSLYSKYPTVTLGRDGSSVEQKQLIGKLIMAVLFALFLMYALLAIPLKSYVQPIIIMSIIPFGLIGAVIGHLLFNVSFSLLSIYGLIALSGVLVNDGLIMIDRINQLKDIGDSHMEAVVDAAAMRLRAIILTSITTFVGLIPITLETSLQALVLVPMAVSLGFGIFFATAITLFLIPNLYMVLVDVSSGMTRLKRQQLSTNEKTY